MFPMSLGLYLDFEEARCMFQVERYRWHNSALIAPLLPSGPRQVSALKYITSRVLRFGGEVLCATASAC